METIIQIFRGFLFFVFVASLTGLVFSLVLLTQPYSIYLIIIAAFIAVCYLLGETL